MPKEMEEKFSRCVKKDMPGVKDKRAVCAKSTGMAKWRHEHAKKKPGR